MKNILAFDFGASSGRGILGAYSEGKISAKEISRFSNDPVSINGTLYWDTLRHVFEIKRCINDACREYTVDAIGIDTWGVDFGLIDKNGDLINNPVHYRDVRTNRICDELFKVIPQKELYEMSGIQHISFNTIYQLYYLHKYRPQIIEAADKFLMIPDLFAYFLTEAAYCEMTNASTTGLLDPKTHDWNYELIDRLGFKKSLFPKIIKTPGTYGNISEEICRELSVPPIPVVPVCTHDTASAVVSVPADDDKFIYISCGTWSLMGTELSAPMITDESFSYNYTNEVGFGSSVRFLRNIMGLWLIQESRRQFRREGIDLSFADLEKEALSCEPFKCFIDCDAPEFVPSGNIPERVVEFCRKTGQYVPQNRAEIMMCIYQSLAMKYRKNIEALEKMCSCRFSAIHMVGGGIKDTLLCRLTASACNKKVIAGPTEATSYGNIAAGLITIGELDSLKQARQIIKDSIDIKIYEPEKPELWEEKFNNFYLNIL